MARIGIVSTYLPQKCGIATYTDYLVNGFLKVKDDLEIKIICEEGAEYKEIPKFKAIPCWSRKKDYVEPILKESQDVDVVHIQHEYSIYTFDDRLPRLLQQLNKPKVITIHCVRPAQFSERGKVDEEYAAKIAELADKVIVHLHSQKDILTRLGIDSRKIHVIPHGTEISNADKIESRKRLNLPLQGKILTMFGFVKQHKCAHIVLEALKQMHETLEDVYLFIAGGLTSSPKPKDVTYVEFLQRRIRELALEPFVIFPNRFLPNEDVPYILGASDIVLFPYYEEDRSSSGGFHLAIGALRPIIAARIPKFEELSEISDELLILPYNVEGLANVALRILTDKEFYNYITERTKRYRELTSWKNTAKKHLEVYKAFLR